MKNSGVRLTHCILGGSKPESAEEACCEKATDVATGYVAAEKVSSCYGAFKHNADYMFFLVVFELGFDLK